MGREDYGYSREDLNQVWQTSVWQSKEKGYCDAQCSAYAKYTVWNFKKKQFKHYYRKRCLRCEKSISFTVTQCSGCGGREFENIPMREFPTEEDERAMGIAEYPDPGDEAVARIEIIQFIEFCRPLCRGEYDWYVLHAMLDGMRPHQIAKQFGRDHTYFEHVHHKIKEWYKSFNEGEEPRENPITRIRKTAFVYEKAAAPVRVLMSSIHSPSDLIDLKRKARVRMVLTEPANG